MTAPDDRLRVVIAGGGIAAVEAALALRELAGDRVALTFLAPEPDLVYRPLAVLEPFSLGGVRRYPLAEIARDLDAKIIPESFGWLDHRLRLVHTDSGSDVPYGAVLLALGARTRPGFEHVTTLDDRQLDAQLHGLVQDIEGGFVRRLAFVVPDPMSWPLPIYELALMAAGRADDSSLDISVTVFTPEDSPLAFFGRPASEAVARFLWKGGVDTVASAHCQVPGPGQIVVHPGEQRFEADRIVALPQLYGPATPGVPKNDAGGFIPTDPYGRVRGLNAVFAAGDATAFPVKHGGVAAQQADTAATSIAVMAGVQIEPKPFRPDIHAILLGGPKPLYLSAHITGGHGTSSRSSFHPLWSPAEKVAARYLAPYLAARDQAAAALA